jgi:hypothetical protein
MVLASQRLKVAAAMKKALIFAAIAEAATGLALLIAPSLVGQLLLGEALMRNGSKRDPKRYFATALPHYERFLRSRCQRGFTRNAGGKYLFQDTWVEAAGRANGYDPRTRCRLAEAARQWQDKEGALAR